MRFNQDKRISDNKYEFGHQSGDFGPSPFTVNIDRAAALNNSFRTALWTGEKLQVTLMNIPVGSEIGLENHPETDQLLYIENGYAIVKMGQKKECLDYVREAKNGFAIIIPAGSWHNVYNAGRTPLRLFSVYAPPNHPHGTLHRTKEEAEASEHHHHEN